MGIAPLFSTQKFTRSGRSTVDCKPRACYYAQEGRIGAALTSDRGRQIAEAGVETAFKLRERTCATQSFPGRGCEMTKSGLVAHGSRMGNASRVIGGIIY